MPRNQEPGLLDIVFGTRWQVAAWRATAIFVGGYVVLPWLFGHNKLGSAIQFFATVFTFAFVAVALYGLAESRTAATEELPDDSVLDDQTIMVPAHWSVELLRQIEWKHLSELCVAIYKEKGFHSETSALDDDGNITIWLRLGEGDHPTAIARCRAWGDLKVGVDAVQALMDVMTAGRIGKAFFITPGDFSAEARVLAQGTHLVLVDGKLLLAMLNRLPGETNQQLLNTVTTGGYTIPSCPGCGLKMITSDSEHGPQWGCRTFPRCKKTLAMREVAV